MTSEPKRRLALKIDIQADDLLALRRAMERVMELVTRDGSHSAVSGGYDSGWWFILTETPEQTHDRYVAELETYLEELHRD